MSYLIVGHTHADVDALIGTIVSYLRNVDQMSPQEFAEAVGKGCSSLDGSIDSIENTLATPNYEKNFFASRMRADFDGLTECRELRMSADKTSGFVAIHYKVEIVPFILYISYVC